MNRTCAILDFVHDSLVDIPPEVYRAAKRSLLDLLGVALAGRRTEASRIAHDAACLLWPAGTKSATIIFDGRRTSPAGAAFAAAQTIDSFDAHDGYKPAKGHAGVAVLPALLAAMEAERAQLNDLEFLHALAVGYEVACRVAAVQHRTCPDYHASGSWNALGAAAVTCRVMKLSDDATRHALGIAEYYGPRSQMMRVIAHPTMLKDSSSWGAMAGVSAAYLAAAGFTGAPAITVEAEEAADDWRDLGRRWLILEQYFKPWPVCRWAQPAVQAALELVERHDLQPHRISRIIIETFHEARLLAGHAPANTEEAQYAIAFPTACALARRKIDADSVTAGGLRDEQVLRLAACTEIVERSEFNQAFPMRRLAQVRVVYDTGEELASSFVEPPGDPEAPLPDEALVAKFQLLAEPLLGKEAEDLLQAIVPLDRPSFQLGRMLEVLRGER